MLNDREKTQEELEAEALAEKKAVALKYDYEKYNFFEKCLK